MKRCRECLLELNELGSPDVKRKKIATASIIAADGSQEASDSISKKPIDIFGLNVDVFRKISRFLTVHDLYSLATANDQMEILVMQNCIRGRFFDFEQLADCCHILDVFKVFGKQMTKIKIGEKDVQYKEKSLSKLDEILRLISTYCSMDTLKHLDLQYFYESRIQERYMDVVLPFLRTIESFSMQETDYEGGARICIDYFRMNPDYNPGIDELVERIIRNAGDLTSIKLTCLKMGGRFFHEEHVANLKSLSLFGCNIRVPDGFTSFLEKKPAKLKTFKWDNSSLCGLDTASIRSSNVVYELVADNVSELEVFHYCENEGYMIPYELYFYDPIDVQYDHELLRKLPKLKALTLRTVTMDCLKMLAEMNKVEKLVGNVPQDSGENDFNFLRSYTNLKSIEFVAFRGSNRVHMNYLSKLPQLIECSIKIVSIHSTFDEVIMKAVETAANLSILRITSLTGQLKSDLYPKLLALRLRHGNSTPLVVRLNQHMKDFSSLHPQYRRDIIEIRRV